MAKCTSCGEDTVKPCPYCGSDTDITCEKHNFTVGYTFYIYCWQCSARGPASSTKEGAHERWNTRTVPAHGPGLIDDGMGNLWHATCDVCGAPMVIVRPGDARCSAACAEPTPPAEEAHT